MLQNPGKAKGCKASGSTEGRECLVLRARKQETPRAFPQGGTSPAPPGRKLEVYSQQRLNQIDSELWDLRQTIGKERSIQ